MTDQQDAGERMERMGMAGRGSLHEEGRNM